MKEHNQMTPYNTHYVLTSTFSERADIVVIYEEMMYQKD